jgi:hypothetical protein
LSFFFQPIKDLYQENKKINMTIGYGENGEIAPLLINNDPHLRRRNFWRLKQSTRTDLRKLGVVAFALFCLASFIALGHASVMMEMIFSKINTIPFPSSTSIKKQAYHTSQKKDLMSMASTEKKQTNTTKVLIVHSGGPHLEKLATSVQQGVEKILCDPSKQLRVRTLEDVTFQQDILWADGIILGTHVINANVEPKVT